MNPKVEINSLLFSKLKNDQNFTKYDIEAALDEVENTETQVKLKFKFVLLSNPTNAKITVEGLSTVNGNQSETSKLLTPDEKNIPLVVNMIYQEIFPLFYIISKSMQIPCPAYQLSKISQSQQIESEAMPPAIEETVAEAASATTTGGTDNVAETPANEQIETEQPAVQEPAVQEPAVQEPAVQEPIVQEPIVQEPSVSSI